VLNQADFLTFGTKLILSESSKSNLEKINVLRRNVSLNYLTVATPRLKLI